jgi:ribonuclease VapC
VIAVDTSALMAIVLGEPEAGGCMAALGAETQILISAGTLAEALIVAGRRAVSDELEQIVNGLDLDIVPVTTASARRVAGAYGQWGRGMHPAGLNLGDCFAYEVAKGASCPLLFIGNDFARTDIESVL